MVDGVPVVSLLFDSTDSAGTKLALQETSTEVMRDIATLSELEREIIEMRHVDCMTFPEMGAILEIKSATVKKRYYRILEKLREKAAVRQ